MSHLITLGNPSLKTATQLLSATLRSGNEFTLDIMLNSGLVLTDFAVLDVLTDSIIGRRHPASDVVCVVPYHAIAMLEIK